MNIKLILTGLYISFSLALNAQFNIKSVSISQDKMNILYVGVDNPLSISVIGINTNDIEVSVSGVEGAKISGENAKYIVRATQQTEKNQFCYVNVKNYKTGQNYGSFPFRVKRIPNPKANLNGNTDATLTASELKSQTAVELNFEDFDYDVKCKILEYTVWFTEPGKAAISFVNSGENFNAKTKELIGKAVSGAQYRFSNIKCNCPGDTTPRTVNSIFIEIITRSNK
jgi:hypothetical protein